MKRFFASLAGLLAFLILAALLLPYFIPQSVLERHLRPLLANETGIQLKQAEQIRLSFVPELAAAIDGVGATLPVKGQHDPDIHAERIVAALRPSALIRGRVELKSLTFEKPTLIVNRPRGRVEGPARHPLLKKAAAEEGSRPASEQFLKIANTSGRKKLNLPALNISILDGSVILRTRGDRQTVMISGADLAVTSPSGGAPAVLEGKFYLKDQPVDIRGTATPSGPDAAIQIAFSSAAMRTDIDGVLALTDEPRFKGGIRAELTSGQALAEWVGSNPERWAEFDSAAMTGTLMISPDRIGIYDGKIAAPDMSGDLFLERESDGRSVAILKPLTLHGGAGDAMLMLDDRLAGATVVSGSLSLSGVDALALTRGLNGFDWVSGKMDAAIRLAGAVRRGDKFAESLKGTGQFSVSDGAIEGFDLPSIVAEAKKGEFGKWRRATGRRTPFDRMAATFAIEKGVAKTKDLSLTGPNIQVTGEGRTDIARGKIKYRLKTVVTARGESASTDAQSPDAALTIPLIVKGNWEKPDIYPDLESAIEDPDSLQGTAKLFGKSVEKLTNGEVKADDFGRMIDGLFGKKKKKKDSGHVRKEN